MRIFVAGSAGAIGTRLVPLLVAGGHHVVATTRRPDKLKRLRDLGAEPLILDGLDPEAVLKAVVSSHPEVIVHQMTALASMSSLKHFDDELALTNRLRTEGTRYPES
jgi:nucleoside-diphosphate-sugar epimerase